MDDPVCFTPYTKEGHKREWHLVKRKKLPNTLLIERRGENTYADMLGKVKKDPSLQEVGKKVNKLRRAAAADF